MKLSSEDTVHLHADLTALLTAAHFDLLDKVEASFGPIALAHGTLVALAAMREASHSIQPARRISLKEVDVFIHAGKIDVFQYSSDDLEISPEDSGGNLRASRMYRKALAFGWLVGDFGPPLDDHGLPAEGQPHDQRLIFRSPHCIVESLQALGEISGDTTANALATLGPEHHPPIERKIDKGRALVCGAGILESLAAGGALEAAANVFELHLDTAEVEAFIKSPLVGFDQADAEPTGMQLMVEDTASTMRYVLADLPLGILSLSTAERESAVRKISSQFDLFQKTCDDAIARIAPLSDPNTRTAEIVRLKSQSAAFLYSDLFQKIRAQDLIATPDFLFQDPTIIARHLRLNRLSEVQSPDDRLDAAAATLLEEVGVEQTVVRLCGIPKPMPSAVLVRIGQMSQEDRRRLLKRLIQAIGPSPIGAAHLTKLFVHFTADRRSYIRYAKCNLRKIAEAADGIPLAAWRKLLKFVERELWYTEGFRTLADDVRLFVAWTHADRLFRIMIHAGVDAKWIRDYFGDGAIRLPAEVVSGDGDYVRDIAHPDRIDKWTLTLAMIAYASEKGRYVESGTIALLSQRSQAEAGKLISLVVDARLAPDAMNSLMRQEGDASWLAILTPALAELITASRSSSALGEMARTVRSGGGDLGWVSLQAVLRDFPIPKELESDIREALLDLDLVALSEKNPNAVLLALTFAAQHGGQLGPDVVDSLRAKLLLLTENYAEKERQGSAPDDRADGGLVSAAFYLYSRGPEDGRYAAIAKLLHDLVLRWPTLASSCRIMIDRLIEGLPNSDSRILWKLQVQLRSIA